VVGRAASDALADAVNGLYKAELIRQRRPWRTVEQVELATLESDQPAPAGQGNRCNETPDASMSCQVAGWAAVRVRFRLCGRRWVCHGPILIV